MRKYFTRRCMGIHALALVVVPGCLLAGWWQYDAAVHGNGLSWAYTVEWPLFALYAVYMWWQLIHDKSTPLAKLRAAKERSAAAAAGRPLEEIPGWALDKDLSRAMTETALGTGRTGALATGDRPVPRASLPTTAAADTGGPSEPDETRSGDGPGLADRRRLVDAEVVDVSVNEDEELRAYNRYLAELATSDPPKRW